MADTTITPNPGPATFDLKTIKARLEELFNMNGIKASSVKGRTLEYGYIQGLVIAYGAEQMKGIMFLHQCGRSIVD